MYVYMHETYLIESIHFPIERGDLKQSEINTCTGKV